MGIGTWELMVIGLIALVVLGPKQMIVMARKAGELLRQMQEIWAEASKTIDKEIKAIEEEAGDITTLPKEITALTNEMKNALTLDLNTTLGRPESTAAQNSIRPPTAPSAWTETPPAVVSAPPAPQATALMAPAAPITPTLMSDQSTQPDQSASPDQPATTRPSAPEPTEAPAPTKYPAWTSKRN